MYSFFIGDDYCVGDSGRTNLQARQKGKPERWRARAPKESQTENS